MSNKKIIKVDNEYDMEGFQEFGFLGGTQLIFKTVANELGNAFPEVPLYKIRFKIILEAYVEEDGLE